MSVFEIQQLVVVENIKFGYSTTTLIFATLALSLQFSPGMGTELPYVLVLAWILFLLAGIAGGYNLLKTQYFYRTNVLYSESKAAKDSEGMKRYKLDLDKFDKEMMNSANVRNWLFLSALFLNMTFAVTNYLHRAGYELHFCFC